jgi:squalene-hopene cyclase-like protein/prenyltransferase/squalene oxidase-like repeat protein
MHRHLAVAVLSAAALAAPAPCRAEEAPKPADTKAARTAAYDRGLEFLRSRAVEGKWGPPAKADPGVTALAATAFLERPGGVAEKDRPVVDAAVAWLRSLQKANGGIYEEANGNYTTALAVQALVLHGKEGDREAVDKALGFLRRMQFCEEGGEGRRAAKGDLNYGGIGYGSDPTKADLSNTQFALDSLRAAGVPESDPAFQRALVFLRRTQNRKENETEGEKSELLGKDGKTYVRSADGGAGYTPFESKAGALARPDGKMEVRSYGSMTYALLKCYLYAGLKASDAAVADAVKWIAANYSWEENPGFPDPKEAQQGLYYYFATASRALEALGDAADLKGPDGKSRDWRGDLAWKLLSLQKPDGSWVNPNGRWEEGLPEVSTSFALKALAKTVK